MDLESQVYAVDDRADGCKLCVAEMDILASVGVCKRGAGKQIAPQMPRQRGFKLGLPIPH